MPEKSKVLSAHLKIGVAVLVGCLIAAIVSGCGSTKLIVKHLDAGSKLSRNSNDSIVVGSIEVKGFEGIEVRFGRSFHLLQIPSLRSAEVSFPNGEPFYLILEPGEYQIVTIYRRVAWTAANGLLGSGSQGIQTVDMRFTVKENEVVYIGKLILKFRGNYYDMNIADEYETANTRFQKEFPNVGLTLNKSLMR
jgi:hypothetical protein